MSAGVFVTGTDTGVGKTLACCALLYALRSRGMNPVPMKPIAAGADGIGGAACNGDTRALASASGPGAPALELITPVLLREPMAPHIAAAREGRTIEFAAVREAWARIAATGRFAVVEGVGGFKVPLGVGVDTVDLARLFSLPVVLVVGLRLGCLNHALLTAGAIDCAGLRLAGWIANAIDPAMTAAQENVVALAERLPAPLLGQLPFQSPPDPSRLAAFLDLSALMAEAP
jgi:dethiobiotin synthetase